MLVLVATIVMGVLLHDKSFAVLDPAGTIAHQQRRLMIITAMLSVIVVLPVFTLTAYFVIKYRADNPKARYTPEWGGSKRLETIWWLVPLALISVLAVITWTSTHKLNPSKPIQASQAPLKIQVIAMQWKWLFIYPESNVATLNYVTIPEDRPVEFNITADAPMNSFWIPQLGGQIYAMSGMSTKLNLMADEPGIYRGVSANLSGEGFAGMKFEAKAVPQNEYSSWIKQAAVNNELNYAELLKPTESVPPQTYRLANANIFNDVMKKYVNKESSEHMPVESHQ